MYRTTIEGHPIILDVSTQLRTKYRPDGTQRVPTSDSPTPFIDGLQLGSHPFAASFHLRQRNTPPRPTPIKGKSQKVEDAWPTMTTTRPSKVNQPGLLLIQSQFVPGQPTRECFTHSQGITLVCAADHHIVGISESGHPAGAVGFDDILQPHINHSVRKDIGENRATQAALRNPFLTNR